MLINSVLGRIYATDERRMVVQNIIKEILGKEGESPLPHVRDLNRQHYKSILGIRSGGPHDDVEHLPMHEGST